MANETPFIQRPPLWLPLVVVAVAGAFYLAGKHIEVRGQNMPTIVVSGEGKVQGKATIAELNFGVTTGAQATAKDAMTKLQTEMDSVLKAVKADGINDKDISTQQFNLNPSYDYKDGAQTLRGYEATQTLIVKVHDLDKVGTVLSSATNAGANQAGGVTFTIDDPESLRAQARSQAIDQAKQKAQTLAKQLGMRLGGVRGFNEGSDAGYPQPIAYSKGVADMSAGMGGGPIQIPSGEQDIVVDVSITYELR